jgi:hypothetical protein
MEACYSELVLTGQTIHNTYRKFLVLELVVGSVEQDI